MQGIDFEVRRGEVFGLLGPNGAGKTTTVEILEGYRSRSAGRVSVLGHDPAERDPDLRARMGIVLQSSGIYQYLTVRESVAHWAGFYPRPRDVEEVISIVGLEASAPSSAPTSSRAASSAGSTSRSRWSATPSWSSSTSRPPASTPPRGAPRGARCARCKELGKTVLLTTHYLDEAQALADRVAIIKDGRILAEGPPSSLGAGSGRSLVSWRGPTASRARARPTTRPRCCTS